MEAAALPSNSIKAVIFDLDGVVLSRGLSSFRGYLVEHCGVTDQQVADVITGGYLVPYFAGTITEKEFWEGLLRDLAIDADWHKLRQILLDFYAPNEGILELVSDMRKSGMSAYLLSDQTSDWWPVLDERYNISDHFDKVFTSAGSGFHREDSSFYRHALETIGIPAHQVLFVDDHSENLVSASYLGMYVIHFVSTNLLRQKFEKILAIRPEVDLGAGAH